MPCLRGLRFPRAFALAGTTLAGLSVIGSPPAVAAVAPVDNPPIVERCGLDLTLVLDASGSVQTAGAVNQVRGAAEAFLDALANTDSTARVTQFATVSQQLAPSTSVDDQTLGPGGALRQAIDGYYNPRPPRPDNVNFINTSGNVNNSASNNQYTNWDGSLHQAAETVPDLVVYVTDGDPTAYDLDKPGDPGDPGPPPDIRYGTSSTDTQTNDRAIQEANRVKTNGSRMLAVGVGSALNNSASQQRLTKIAGPQIVRDADLATVDSLNDIDVALVTRFEDLAQFLRHVVLQLCSPSLTIQKLAQTSGSAAYLPAQGWDMTVTPRVPTGTGFTWILPDTADAPFKTVTTNSDGFAAFQWEPIPPEADSAATVSEALQSEYTAGRPGPNNDFSCDFKDEDGTVRHVTGELDLSDPDNPTFDLDPIGQEIGTCKVYNSFDYQPAIALTKTNSPTEVRGDLDPPAEVTSDFRVTNPGNTPLSNVSVSDDQCGAATPVPATGNNAGDTNGNGKLDPGEEWQFTCQRAISTPSSTDPDGQNIVNNATATGTPPQGDPVTATDSDDVDAFNPAISLTKQVNGQDSVQVTPGTQVTYTYRVANEGNTPLGSVDLTDDTPPCTAPTRGADDPGDNDATLDVGETWTYSCTASPSEDVHNVADVEATPLNPNDNDAPFPAPNPTVTAQDDASVTIINPNIHLEKTADPTFVMLPENGAPQQVTYHFQATNPGNQPPPLNRPGAASGGPSATDEGWVEDPRCDAPTQYESGDTNGNEMLDSGETWNFTCTNTVGQTTVNIARIEGQPSQANGAPIPGVLPVHDFATAIVRVARPGIQVVKTALRDPVLDPDADPISGPDFPTPRQAEYTYDVTNTGTAPLDIGAGPTDDICSPLTEVGDGDDNANGLLDPDEVWHYTCATTLQREQGNTPPVTGNESGLVTNTASVTGTPNVDGTTYPDRQVTDTDTAQVTVIQPGIAITKTASPSAVLAGRDVTYTFKVTNTGDVGLTDVTPVDDKCAPLVRTGGDNGNDILEGANSGDPESWTYTCTRAIDLPQLPDTEDVNTVSVTGVDPLGNTYQDQDSATVKVLAPAIHLEKSVSDSLVLSGSRVTYRFEVTNIGQSPVEADDVLDNVTLGDVSDPANPGCRRPELVAKEGGNQDDFLDRVPAETWVYQCRGTITQRTVDLAGVRALGGSTIDARIPVFDFATAQVTAFHPGISVEKSATPTHLENGGGKVTYTYLVRNTGDVPLADVKNRITDDTCSPVRYVKGDRDGDGLLDSPKSLFEDSLDETWMFTCTTVVHRDTTNTVVVSGVASSADGQPLCDDANGGGGAAGKPTCEPTDSDVAHVTVSAATGPETGNNPPTGPGTFPDTGGGPVGWPGDVPDTRSLLGLAALLIALGAALITWAVRRRGSAA
jgi:uncharacterized repeat protein (TIGR01451 family)